MVKSAGIERYFRMISYLVAISGLFALFASGGVGIIIFTGFILTASLAWFLEDTKWQLSERVAIVVVVAVLIAFFADWKFNLTGSVSIGVFAATGLARLILLLALVKLLQKKADKDWIFIYLISFFEVLLAAGLSISPIYLVSLFLYLLFTTCAILAFEIRRSSRVEQMAGKSRPASGIRRLDPSESASVENQGLRLPAVSIVMLAAIAVIGLPIFFTLPRGNAAGFGSDYTKAVNVTGFSDSVTLGTIGRLQQNDAIVMRVRIDRNNNEKLNRFLWRGVALDQFDNRRWTKSNPRYRQPFVQNENNLILLDYPPRTGQVTIQTFYLEPLSTDVLFALRRPFALKGPEIVSRDAEGALLGIKTGNGRISYSAYSDTSRPPADDLREDAAEYGNKYLKYLQVPGDLDPRISRLAESIMKDAGAYNRFDIAEAVERRLVNGYGYSLDMKAGGDQPVADFLFNVKEGHCEYFASAMALMLRTQGIATRVVNGFQSGDFNETAGVFIVRQQNAHSWVEVYFPETGSWVAFNPTPPDGNAAAGSSYFGFVSGYIEALETFWIQYVVAYDGQEQRTLFSSFRDGIGDYMNSGSVSIASLQSSLLAYWEELRGDKGVVAGFRAATIGAAVLALFAVLVFFAILIRRLVLRLNIAKWLRRKIGLGPAETLEFYERLGSLLSKHGLNRKTWQTPAEFARGTGIPEVVKITEVYHRVRYGGMPLEEQELKSIQLHMDSISSRLLARK